jgi:hypothetical protein
LHELSFHSPIVPRRGGGPVTCGICGCRLTPAAGLEGTAWRHFQIRPGQDARGCRPSCLESLHRADGSIFQPLEHLMEPAALA